MILNWEPISNLDRFIIPEESNINLKYYNLPPLVFINKFSQLIILGNDLFGRYTTGCSCCSERWSSEEIEDYGYTEFAILDLNNE